MSPVSAADPLHAHRVLCVSPLVSVRWSGGNIQIVTPSCTTISAFDDRILPVLQAFASPRSVAEASSDLRELPPSLLAIYLAALTDCGALVDADQADEGGSRGAGERNSNDVTGLAGAIATLIRTVARDARAMAPHLEWQRGSDEAVDVASRLEHVRDTLAGVAAELQRARPEYVQQQRRALAVPRDGELFKLHLGCGGSRLPGWVNVDYPPADVAIDLGWTLPFEDASVGYAYLAHVLEHFEYPLEARALLQEVHRVLAPGGVLRLVVPDIEKCIRAYAAGDMAFFDRRADFWPGASNCETPLEHFLHYAGAGDRSHAFWGHKYGYDFETLGRLLVKAGFEQIDRSEFMESEHAALRVDSASKAASYRCGEDHYSLFVEANKSPRALRPERASTDRMP